jgi:hypothetical protein
VFEVVDRATTKMPVYEVYEIGPSSTMIELVQFIQENELQIQIMDQTKEQILDDILCVLCKDWEECSEEWSETEDWEEEEIAPAA